MTNRYTDNGDGTITDTRTGLMWEKLSADGSIHDVNNTYTWANASAVKIAGLNGGGGFAGHTDWRLPTARELGSLVDYTRKNPAIDPLFVCQATSYWSATTYQSNPSDVWFVNFYVGSVYAGNKPFNLYVRAVRGDS